jgi:hypothetical protein
MDFQQWLIHSENELLLRYCGYWHNLLGNSPITGTQKRVQLSRTNVLTPETLGDLMHQVGMNGRLS